MILTKQSEKVDDRMEGVTIDTPKEKLGTPGFLRSIGSIFSKLSPKQFQRRPKLPQPTDAIQETIRNPLLKRTTSTKDEKYLHLRPLPLLGSACQRLLGSCTDGLDHPARERMDGSQGGRPYRVHREPFLPRRRC